MEAEEAGDGDRRAMANRAGSSVSERLHRLELSELELEFESR